MSKLLFALTLISAVLVSGTACRKAPAPDATTTTAATTWIAGGWHARAAAPAPAPRRPRRHPRPADPDLTPPAPVPATAAERARARQRRERHQGRLRAPPAQHRAQQPGPVPAERRDEIYRKVLDELVTYTLLKQEAKARNVTVTDAEVEEQLNAMQQAARERGRVQEGARRAQDDARAPQDRRPRPRSSIAKMMNAQVADARRGDRRRGQGLLRQEPRPVQARRDRSAPATSCSWSTRAPTRRPRRRRADEDRRASSSAPRPARTSPRSRKQNSQDGSAAQGGDLGYFPKGRWCRPSPTSPSRSRPARSATS